MKQQTDNYSRIKFKLLDPAHLENIDRIPKPKFDAQFPEDLVDFHFPDEIQKRVYDAHYLS